MIVLDTNVVSELMRPRPNAEVLRWLDGQPRDSIWITTINIFELRFGLQTMPTGKRQAAMNAWFERWLIEVVQQRIAVYDEAAARMASDLAAGREKKGRPGELRDTMIAGIVLANHATLATRNIRHFEDIAKWVVNPWSSHRTRNIMFRLGGIPLAGSTEGPEPSGSRSRHRKLRHRWSNRRILLSSGHANRGH